jgi:hypothetical protein
MHEFGFEIMQSYFHGNNLSGGSFLKLQIKIPVGEYPLCTITCHDKKEIDLELRDPRLVLLIICFYVYALLVSTDEIINL